MEDKIKITDHKVNDLLIGLRELKENICNSKRNFEEVEQKGYNFRHEFCLFEYDDHYRYNFSMTYGDEIEQIRLFIIDKISMKTSMTLDEFRIKFLNVIYEFILRYIIFSGKNLDTEIQSLSMQFEINKLMKEDIDENIKKEFFLIKKIM